MFAAFPALTRVGLIVLGLGVTLDLAAHLLGAGPSLAARCCEPAFVGHLVTLAGMILAVAGVLVLVVRRSRPTRPREGRS
jgi:hypothetical protein